MRREGEDHDEVVHRDLDQGVVRVAAGHLGPDEDHGGAGRSTQQDQAGDVGCASSGGDQAGANRWSKNSTPSAAMVKGLISQLTTTRDDQALRAGRGSGRRLAKSTADHHRVDHGPDQHGDDEVDRRVLRARPAARTRPGAMLPSTSPVAMHRATQSESHFSNRPMPPVLGVVAAAIVLLMRPAICRSRFVLGSDRAVADVRIDLARQAQLAGKAQPAEAVRRRRARPRRRRRCSVSPPSRRDRRSNQPLPVSRSSVVAADCR